ncbi:MAG TPA: folylpolyglutamate synthase/dihydrofolate synthase family protein [Candidatus Aquicultor sp.]|jgi:dihydrofolate synthase/folylpolyglutamate synthase
MTYEEVLSYITNALQFGINPGLEKIEAICKHLGNPQLKYPTIQITGTNGKTSTTWMLRELLTASGMKTGCYTSPHLHTYRERITVDGEMVSEADFAATFAAIQPAIEQVKTEHGDLTEFEILTAMALHYFAVQNVDVAVFEVGLGGRWDATSVVRPKVSVITGISLDHTDRLGSTVEAIAWDKAHIIKEGATAVIGMLPEGALDVIKQRCLMVGAPAKLFGTDFMPKNIEIVKNEGARFSIAGLSSLYDDVRLPVFGMYQVLNFTTAVAALEVFTGDKISSEVLSRGAKGLTCPGRFELVSRDPLVVLDGAHNPEGIDMVVEGLPQSFSYKNLHIVLAISSDKDIEQMLATLEKHASTLILSQNSSYRSASAKQLTGIASKLIASKPSVPKGVSLRHTTSSDIALEQGNSYIIEPDLEKAVRIAVSQASKEDLVCITGSLYTVADARDVLLGEP